MKKIVLLFCFFGFQLAYSQNWTIINSTDKFNYRLDGDNIITSTLWIDSIAALGSDSVFYMNRFLCDSCITIPGSPSGCDSCYGYKNVPGFLQRTILFSNNVYNLKDTDNVYIVPFAHLNDNWIFDSLENVTAQVVYENMDSVFQTIDSIKIILLSSGDSIVISQNYGLLMYPHGYSTNRYYRLVGIEGRNLGEQVPKFFNFFNFDVGDIFEFHTDGAIGGGCHYWRIEQYTITSKLITGDTLSYSLSGVYEEKQSTGGWGTSCSPGYGFGHYSGNIEFIDSLNHFTNKYNRQPVKLGYQLQNMLPCTSNDSAFDGVRTSIYVNNWQSKSFGFPVYSQLNSISDTLDPNSQGPYSATYVEGLGCTSYAITPCFEGGEWGHLAAFKKGNFTSGTFSDSTAILLGLTMIGKNQNIVFPNPANDKLFHRLSNHGNYLIKIFNSFGEIVKEVNSILFTDYIRVDDLPTGIYFVNTVTDSFDTTEKIIVLH